MKPVGLVAHAVQLGHAADAHDEARLVQPMLEVRHRVGAARDDQALAAVLAKMPEQLVQRARLHPLEGRERQHGSLPFRADAGAADLGARLLPVGPGIARVAAGRSTRGGWKGSRSQRTPSAS